MTLPNNSFATHSGVSRPSQESAEASSLLVPTGVPVMVAPVAHPFGTAPLHTGVVNSVRSPRPTRGHIVTWMPIVCRSISPMHGFTPYRFDHLDDYVNQFSNPLFQS